MKRKKSRVLFLMGTRPEVIKLAPVLLAAQRAKTIQSIICLSGQHAHMAEQMLRHFKLKADASFEIPRQIGNLTALMSGVTGELSKLIAQNRPDIIVVQGDTTSAMLGAIAGFYEKIPVAHIEAGLRSFDLHQPFPEELNRRIISIATAIHFCPTAVSKANLIREGVLNKNIRVVGNTCIDALLWTLANNKEVPVFSKGKRGVLVTAHRRENWDTGIASLCDVLVRIEKKFADTEIVFAVHRNPIVVNIVQQKLKGHNRIRLVEPMDYQAFSWAMKRAHMIVSDSGGVQEEALALGTPVLVARNVTERPEVLEGGTVKLIGAHPAKLWREAEKLLTDPEYYKKSSVARFPFGHGNASDKILRALDAFKL